MKQQKAAPNQRPDWPEVNLPAFPDRMVKITEHGAVAGGKAMNTRAFARAIGACAAAGGGTVLVPAGLWLTGPIQLQSGIDLHLEKGAIVLFSPRFEDYPPVRTIYEGREGVRCASPVSARKCENIALTGEGIFDGSGQAWRPVKRFKLTDQQWNALVASGGVVDETGKMWWPSVAAMNGQRFLEELEQRRGGDGPLEEYAEAAEYLRPVLVSLAECRRVLIDGPTFQNSPSWCLHPLLCEDLTIRRVDVRNPWWAQNGDALDLDSCRNVVVADSIFDAGDDAICLKSGKDEAGRKRGRPTENVTVTGCVVYHGHGGFVIGSEMSGGVRNVKVSDCAFIGTDTGLRFKSTRGRGGVVENIRISGINMIDIKEEAITFSSYYGIKDQKAEMAEVNEGTPRFRNFHLKDLVCHGAKRAALFQGLPEMPVQEIHLENVLLEAETGVSLIDAENIRFEAVEIQAKSGPAVTIEDGREIALDIVGGAGGPTPFLKLTGQRTNGVKVAGVQKKKDAPAFEVGEDVRPDALRFA